MRRLKITGAGTGTMRSSRLVTSWHEPNPYPNLNLNPNPNLNPNHNPNFNFNLNPNLNPNPNSSSNLIKDGGSEFNSYPWQQSCQT